MPPPIRRTPTSTPPVQRGRPAARRHRRRLGTGGRIAARVAIYLVLCWGIVAVLLNGLFSGALLLVLALALYSTAPIVFYLTRGGWGFYPRAAFRIGVVRVVLYAQLVLPFVAAAGAIGLVAGAPFGAALPAGRVAAGAMLVIAAMVLFAGYVGSRVLVVREVEAAISGLPDEFEGLRIAQISDLHVGPHVPRGFLQRMVRAAHSVKPDMIVATGDLVDDYPEDVEWLAAGLADLQAPLGVYMIPGNHDVYAGWDDVARSLAEFVEAEVLVNDARIIFRGDATLAVVGIGDPAGGRPGSSSVAPDISRAFRGVPKDAVVVALAHNPALWPPLRARGAALTLSGHTHWGQLAFPKLGWTLVSRFVPFDMGAHVEGDALLYINPGTGYWGMPFRIGARPEVTCITLRSAPAGAGSITMGEARRAS